MLHLLVFLPLSGYAFPMTNKKARREINKAYKEQPALGGVYLVTNTQNGKYLLEYAVNLKSVQNRFQWAVSTGTSLDPKLQKDWQELGAQAFTLEILEELEQQAQQSHAQFLDDLKTLEQLWRARLDSSKAY
jgi:hypothetical protein